MNKQLPEGTYKSLIGCLQSIKSECDDAAQNPHPDPIGAGRYKAIESSVKLMMDALVALDFQSTENLLDEAAERAFNNGVKMGRWDCPDLGRKDPIIAPMLKGYSHHCAAAIEKLSQVIVDENLAHNNIPKAIGYLLELKHAFKL